jgi:hypothetical protein
MGFLIWLLEKEICKLDYIWKYVVLKSWDVDILIIWTNFQKSSLGWPQQPPTEKVQKLKHYI